MLTVKELIAALQKCEQSDKVLLASDPEGNKISPLQVGALGLYGDEGQIILWPRD